MRLAGPAGGLPALADRLLVLQPVGTAEGHRTDCPSCVDSYVPTRDVPRSRTRGIIDSQSVKGGDTVGQDTRGYDAGKKVNGRKRFIITDTFDLLLTTMACSASA